MGLTILVSERLGLVDLGTKGLFFVFSGLVCLLIRFLGWSISGGMFSGLVC